MNNQIRLSLATLILSSCVVVNAMDFEVSTGVHDFIVSDIKDDGALGHIKAGDSHTFGVNIALWVKHTTKADIKILAKAETFIDYDQDELDPDHIPIWFDFLLDLNGPIYTINEYNQLRWYVYADNRQNTVSCIEREIRQQYGLGWVYSNGGFAVALRATAGFYYIELDDDTPVARGYGRLELDDGEAANRLQLNVSYEFTKSLSFNAYVNQYSANAGMEALENDAEVLVTYKTVLFGEGSSLNFKVKNVQYNFDRFNTKAVDAVPWDNDTLVQAYASIPIEW